MMKQYINRYGDTHIFTLKDCGNVMWEGNFDYCRLGFPNDYTDAYKAWHNDFPETEMLSFEDFKRVVHQYDEEQGKYKYHDYLMMVKSLRDEIDMVDPSGGCYISVGMSLDFLGFNGLVVDGFRKEGNGFLIIIKK